MIVLEFKKEKHQEILEMAHKMKKYATMLIDCLENEHLGERHYEHDEMDERRRRDSRGRYMSRDDRYEDKRYPEYPIEERGRYGY